MPTMSTKPGPEVGLEEEGCTFPCWRTLPDHILLHIFSFLEASTLAKAGLVCKAWLRVGFDELLWKDLFYRHWGISRSIMMAPGKYSWIQEYKRLLYHTPSVESEVLKQHADQVLHVSFSHNGKMFATCSKDGFIRVWDATYPTSIKYKTDMRKFTWKYTQFSQFNSMDTLLLVSGVHFGSLSTSGEIAVFSLEGEFIMQSRVMNKPYDVFGTWYNDFYLLSGNLHWTGHLNSCSAIWLNKAYQETTSEEESVVMRLFKFSNINASSIRTIMIANCLSDEAEAQAAEDKSLTEDNSAADNTSLVSLPLIGDFFSNQEEEDMIEEQEEPNDAEEGKEEKNTVKKIGKNTSKALQSIQVFENGEFITKFLEVDADEPNNKLNGTIEYSSDYRLAETPNVLKMKVLCGDTSGSELSTNGNQSGSEIGSVNGSSDVFDHSHSSLDVDMGRKSSRSDIEDSQSDQMLTVKRQSLQPSPCSAEHVQFALSDFAPLALEERSESPMLSPRPDLSSIELQSDRNSESSLESQSIEFSQASLEDQSIFERQPSELVDSSTETITGEPQEAQNERVAEVSSQLSSYKYSPKRVLHGQQQRHGERVRDPSTCEHEFKMETNTSIEAGSSSSESLELPEKTPRLAFCCVDYKKQKKVVPFKQAFAANRASNRTSKSKTCLSSNSVETIESDNRFEANSDCAQVKSEHNAGKNIQSKMCLGRQSMEAVEDVPKSEVRVENSQGRTQSKMCTSTDNQSGSDVGIDCVPGRVQSRICAGIGTASMENLENQAGDSDMKIKCKPVRNTCNMQSDTTSVTISSSSSQSNIYKAEDSVPKLKYKSKRAKKKKARKVKDKYLIFTKGSETYTPHQIGIKRIKPFSDDGSRLLPNVADNTHNLEQGDENYDDVDHLIDMHGHIIGMTLSPDQRYLYVNSRPWPKNYHIENPLYPPPIAQEIDIHVIDLLNMREVGTMHRAHKAYTSNDECFFIFLDVCEEYVASGAEDKHGYLWDRHYGLCLHKYPHTDVVNSVAFNPADPEVLVTVSDDFSIKIWRSLSREKEVVKAFNKEHSIRVKHVQALMSETSEFDEKVSSFEEKT
ncbi:uncharacterized protein LOC132756525 isoform X2 [Ruditapes philippinarum]|nr:uncharacterized protein LOC132756525 isoform X2 [Ruditapes philippinarum]